MKRSHRPVVVVVPCGAAKADHACAASVLYTSEHFRSTLAAAGVADDDVTVMILSAKHGLLSLTDVVAPYDVKMGDPGSVTAADLVGSIPVLRIVASDADVYAMLPHAYFGVLDDALRTWDIYAADVYEATRGIGDHRGVAACIRRSALVAA